MKRALAFVAALALTLAPAACSRNPATGKLQFALISESEEIALGQKGDDEIVSVLGEYTESPQATALVVAVGKKLSAASERPELPWSFRVLDDPGVNAFALPGGYLYVTRGLLAHLSTEDELAAVIGHEIGHVSARHAAVQMRKTAVAQASVGLFRVIDPNLQHVGGIAARSAGLALLRYGRDDEHEADDLSVRYVTRTGYDPNAITEVFRVLASITAAHDNQRVPTWLSTHPEPEQRIARVQGRLTAAGIGANRQPPNAAYLQTIEGIVVGDDPRDGYVLGRTFVHPRAGFRIDLPPEWQASHQGVTVLAFSPDEKALFLLAPSEAESAKAGLAQFFADGRAQRGEGWTGRVGGYVTESATFAIGDGGGRLVGLIAFVELGKSVLVLVAVGPESDWAQRAEALGNTFGSFRGLTEPALRDVAPMRVVLFTLTETMTVTELHRRHPSVVDVPQLARLNHATADEPLPAGRIVKRVEGFNPERVTQ